MSNELTLFSLIPAGPKRNQVFQKLIADKVTLTLKNEKDEHANLNACSLNPQGDIQCHAPEGLPFQIGKDDLLTCSFTIQNERYMMEVKPFVSENLVTLKVEVAFHLQRRKNFRYKIPNKTDAFLQIKTLNKASIDLKCSLTDLSNEGCSALIGIEQASLNLYDVVSAWVVVDEQKPISVQGLLKNLRMYDEKSLTLGLEFDHISESSEAAIIDCITYLQRKAYRKKAA